MEKAEMIFITGGVRSGKSAFAEELAVSCSLNDRFKPHYIACGMASDPEMARRIKKHQQDRDAASVTWITWEQPYRLSELAGHFGPCDVAVVDCLTTLLNNYLFFQQADSCTAFSSILDDISSLTETCGKLIIVSNELFQGSVHEEGLTKTYQQLLGKIHQRIVKSADKAYLIEHGIRIQKKGGAG
jgi:adenosylcobinamide kinase/adenosylcobinamide-phosphate guanylyltransferase